MAERIPVISGAARAPTGKFLGNLASFSAPQLGAIVIKEAVRRSGIAPDAIDEVIMGNVSRRASGRLRRGRPPSTPVCRMISRQ